MTHASTEKTVVAVFDFDGTLTRHDTLFPFLLHVAGPLEFSFKLLTLLPVLALYALGLIRNDIAKTKVLQRFLSNMALATLQQQALLFAERKIPVMQRKEAMDRLTWHKQQTHRCVVVSASLELYLRPWALKAGFDDIVGSKLEMTEGEIISGNLLGENCFGPEKMRQLTHLLGPRENYILYAYGDSRGDKELLSAADYAFYKSFTQQGQYK